MTDSRKNKIIFVGMAIILIGILMALECSIQVRSNESRANKTSAILINQVEEVISENEREEAALVASLKEDYITRAKAISYTIDHNPDLENNLEELRKVAELMSVDEIHLFDESGTIYSGTQPEYYGYNFESGDQISYFRKMLGDKSLTMCQDVTPNTAASKSMMYAMCWNDAGTRMVQVGIAPLRLMKELKENEVSEVVEGMPSYEGVHIIVADADTYEILGCTKADLRGQTLEKAGLTGFDLSSENTIYLTRKVNGTTSYCAMDNYKDYIIAVTQEKAVVNQSVGVTAMVVFLYLMAAAGILLEIVRKMTKNVIVEQKNAVTDPMTGFLNRRGYENMLLEYPGVPKEQNFTYVSMDLNGLKVVNDTFGHAAGDELIKGAAECMQQCLGTYGMLFRTGGDEFAAIIFATEEQVEWIRGDLKTTMAKWSDGREYELSVSFGAVLKKEYPDKDVPQLAVIADERMYQDKENYYKKSGKDRRSCRV